MRILTILIVAFFLTACTNPESEPDFKDWLLSIEVVFQDGTKDTLNTTIQLGNHFEPRVKLVTEKSGFARPTPLTPCLIVGGNRSAYYNKTIACYVRSFKVLSVEQI